MLFFLSLPNKFWIWDLFDTDWENYEYMLKGFVFYWGMHYYTVFRIFTGEKFEWVRFDDTSITKKTWEEVLLTSVET